jgi:hypothetical protein
MKSYPQMLKVPRLAVVPGATPVIGNVVTHVLCVLLLLVPLGAVAQSPSDEPVQLGLDAIERGDFETAYSILLPLGESGDPEAQYNIGVMYLRGDGVVQDRETAIRWYELAGHQGHIDAQYNLGRMYLMGEYVDKGECFMRPVTALPPIIRRRRGGFGWLPIRVMSHPSLCWAYCIAMASA